MKLYILIFLTALVACTNTNRSYEDKVTGITKDSVAVPDHMRNIFYDLPYDAKDPIMVHFPDHNGYKVVLVTYTDSAGNPVSRIHTFDNEWKMYDYLQIESIEPLDQYSLFIVQDYTIDNEYKITESKHINNLIIEQLTYEITKSGVFSEIRDGKQKVIAYEMFDNTDTFVVESFVWDTSPKGTLIKKDLIQTTYQLKNLR